MRTPDHATTTTGPTRPHVAPLTLQLADHTTLRFTSNAPIYAADRRLAVAHSTLYNILGTRIDTPHPYLAAYVGKTAALFGGPDGPRRATRSWNHWVTAMRAIEPTGIATLHAPHLTPDQLSVTEARVITQLSTDKGNIALTNTHTSAEKAASRLTQRELDAAVALADETAHTIWAHGFAHATNPWPAPAPNLREAAVRIVLRLSREEGRGVTAREVVTELNQNGYRSSGKTRARSVRRDLGVREIDSRCPRIRVLHHEDQPLYHAVDLAPRDAISGYIRKYPWAWRGAWTITTA